MSDSGWLRPCWPRDKNRGGNFPRFRSCREQLGAAGKAKNPQERTRSSSSEGRTRPEMEFTVTKLYYIPYIGVVSGLVGIITSYVIAVARGDVKPWLPYISDAGGDSPQSSIFSFSMIVVSFCFLVGVTLCHLILLKRNIHGNMLVKWLNRLLLIAGVTTSSGMIILAVNPVGHLNRDGSWALTVFLPHMVGAVVMFTSGIGLMIILATCTTILDYPDWKQRNFFVRCAAAVIGLVSGFLTIGYCPVGEMDKLKPLPDRARDYPPGAIVSAICEWIVVLTFLAFSLSFAAEFRKFKLCLRLEYRDVDGGAAPLPVKPDASPEKPGARD